MDQNRDDVRKEVAAADATGLVAGEELITQAETLLPVLALDHQLPHEDLHAALPGEHDAHGAIDELHAEMQKPTPSAQAVRDHVLRLRLIPELEATVVTWWEKPAVQRFFADLGQIGV